MAAPLGRLFVTVDADTTKALASIRQVSAAAKIASQNFERLRKSAAGSSGSKMATQMDRIKKSSEGAAKGSRKAGEEFKKTGDKAKKASSSMVHLQASTHRLSQAFVNLRYGNPLGIFAGLSQAMTSLGRGMKSLPLPPMISGFVALAAAAAAVNGAVILAAGAFAKFGLKEAANLEMLRIQYEGLLGSAQRGAAEVEYILNLGKESVVPTEGLLEANRLLLAYGVTADQTRQSLVQFFSDFGSATGISSARLNDMAYALGQVQAQGKANQIDMRQLANAGLNLALVYEKVAEQQGISAAEAKKLTSEGKMTAAVLIPAITALGDNYADAAEKARDSVQGILANLKDIAKIKIGTAFEGLLKKLKPLLKWAEEFLEAFDFSRIAQSITVAVDVIMEAFGSIDADATDTANGVAEAFSFVIQTTARTIAVAVASVRTYYNALRTAQYAVVYAAAEATKWIIEQMLKVADVAKFIPGPYQLALQQITSNGAQWAENMDGYARSAESAMRSAAASTAQAWNAALGAITDWKPTKWDPRVGTGLYGQERLGQNNSQLEIDLGDDGGGKKKKEVDKLAEALKKLRSEYASLRALTAKPLGSESQIEKALKFDDTTFQGSSSQIVSMFTKMRDAVGSYYKVLLENATGKTKSALLKSRKASQAAVKAQFQQIYDLAKQNEDLAGELEAWKKSEVKRLRDAIDALEAEYAAAVKSTESYYDAQIEAAESALDRATQAYDDANSKLQSLISERDNYLSGIRESAFAFVNSLSDVNEAISKVTDLDEMGSFSAVSGEGTADFKAQLQSRLDAVKQWRADIETLLARGLDRNLMDALIAAGPDGGGALATALANETDAGLAEINSIQAELTASVSGLQSSVSSAFFDQGIAQQQAFTNQMAANVATAQAYLDQQQRMRDEALLALEADYEARRKALEEQIASVEAGEDAHSQVLLGLMETNAIAAQEISEQIQSSVAFLTDKKNPKNLYKLGKGAIQGLIDGMEKKRPAALAKARSIANQISATIAAAFQINSPSRVMMGYGENISEGLAIGMENGISKVDMAAARVANSAMISGEITAGAPTVKVFIGDTELRDIVDVQITDASGRDFDAAFAGRRDF